MIGSADDARGDRALARRILAGDEAAFRDFFGAQVRGLYRYVSSRVNHNADSTREIVQSTLAKAIDSLGSFRGEGSLVSWLYGICRFEINAFYRSKKRAAREEPLEAVAARVSDIEGPDAALERKETRELVHETLDQLPRHYGDVLEWKYLEGLSVKQIAELLGVAPKAAESLLTRARQAFRRDFERTRTAASPRRSPRRKSVHGPWEVAS